MSEQPTIFIQWKGTDICADFYCECVPEGEVGRHLDEITFGRLECSRCGKKWYLPHTLELLKEPPEADAVAISSSPSLPQKDDSAEAIHPMWEYDTARMKYMRRVYATPAPPDESAAALSTAQRVWKVITDFCKGDKL